MSDSETQSAAGPPRRAGSRRVEIEPTVAGRVARWGERVRILRASVESVRAGMRRSTSASRSSNPTHDRRRPAPGALLRLFVLLLPSTLLFVSGLGLYAVTVDGRKVAGEAGLMDWSRPRSRRRPRAMPAGSSSSQWFRPFSTLVKALPSDRDRARWPGDSGRGVRIAPREWVSSAPRSCYWGPPRSSAGSAGGTRSPGSALSLSISRSSAARDCCLDTASAPRRSLDGAGSGALSSGRACGPSTSSTSM